MNSRVHIIFILILVLFCAGCGSLGVYNPATGKREFIVIPTDTEVSMGMTMHNQVTSQFKLSEDKAAVQRVQRIGQRLAQVSDRQDLDQQFYVIDKDELNAFTVPGGKVYIFSGLLNKLKSDDEVAAVLAHEIGHTAAKHTVKKFQAALGYSLIGGVIFSRVEGQIAQQVAQLSSDAVMQIVFSAYGRQDEYQADLLGLKYMDLAGYNMNAMIKTFELLESESKGDGGPAFLRTHPYIKDRITRVKQEIEKINQEDKS